MISREYVSTNRQFWLNHIRSCEGSGQTQKDYCRQHNLKIEQFNYAKMKISRATALSNRNSLLVPLEPSQAKLANNIRIATTSGVMIECPTSVDPKWLGTFLGSMR